MKVVVLKEVRTLLGSSDNGITDFRVHDTQVYQEQVQRVGTYRAS